MKVSFLGLSLAQDVLDCLDCFFGLPVRLGVVFELVACRELAKLLARELRPVIRDQHIWDPVSCKLRLAVLNDLFARRFSQTVDFNEI